MAEQKTAEGVAKLSKQFSKIQDENLTSQLNLVCHLQNEAIKANPDVAKKLKLQLCSCKPGYAYPATVSLTQLSGNIQLNMIVNQQRLNNGYVVISIFFNANTQNNYTYNII